jgi:hypothetical protein
MGTCIFKTFESRDTALPSLFAVLCRAVAGHDQVELAQQLQLLKAVKTADHAVKLTKPNPAAAAKMVTQARIRAPSHDYHPSGSVQHQRSDCSHMPEPRYQ